MKKKKTKKVLIKLPDVTMTVTNRGKKDFFFCFDDGRGRNIQTYRVPKKSTVNIPTVQEGKDGSD